MRSEIGRQVRGLCTRSPNSGQGGSDWSYAAVPVIGPLVGGVFAGWLLRILVLS
jgi:glycerol uptake facilitator-like aquaporin